MKKSKQLAFRGGSYSLIITAVVLAILIVLNICVGALPASLTKLDISATKLYSITSNTKVVVNALQQDVTIYWIVQADKEDSVIENLLGKYESLSSHIDVVKKNPDIYPTFAKQYTDETVENNSLVVESGDRCRYIPYSDIYLTESDIYSYTYTTSFDGEGAITSAIDYVVSETLPQVYCVEGHGESDLPSTFADQVEKANLEVQKLSLLTVEEIPEDAACVVIYGPQSDITEDQYTMLRKYVADGGKLLVMAGPVDGTVLENLNQLIGDYGVECVDGVVVEADRNHYAFQYPYVLLPELGSSDITDALKEQNYSPIIPVAGGLSVPEGKSNVVRLLTTSEESFSKAAGFALTTYEKETGDTDGPFALAVSVHSSGNGEIIWFSSFEFLEDSNNAYSSGANCDLAMNALSALVGSREAIAIRSKSLNYNYLTISESQGSMLKTVMIGILPLAYLGIGIYTFASIRRKQNEAA